MISGYVDGGACGAECSAGSSQKARAKRCLIRHLHRTRQLSFPSQPLPLEPPCKLSPAPPSEPQNPHKLDRTLANQPDDHPPQPSAIFIANNVDLLEQIFLFLPPKSLIRFQSVSKKWLSLISNPAFRSLHSRTAACSSTTATPKALFLFVWNFFKFPKELNFISLSDGYVNSMAGIISHLNNFFSNGEIVNCHSCNGLLALAFKLDDAGAFDDNREFVVYNPTTRQHRLIPRPNHAQPNEFRLDHFQLDFPVTRRFEALNIVFDPLKSDHYKLVYVWWYVYHDSYIEDRLGISVYASETGIWREIMDIPDLPPIYSHFGNGVLWNGDFHWVCNRKYIICLDLDKECLRLEMPSPPVELGERRFWYFGECNGCLYLIEVNNSSKMVFDVFEMARDYSKWIPKYHIDLAPLRSLYPSMVDGSFDPLGKKRCRFGMPFFLDNEKEKKASLVISLQDKLIMYDISDAVVTELAEVQPMDFGCYWRWKFYEWKDTYRHVETLVCV